MSKRDISNADLAVIAVSHLDGAIVSVHLEDIAVQLYKLAPSRFSLRKYPEYLDIHSVRVALSRSAKEENNRLSGSIKNGYMLSATGQQWVNALPSELLSQFSELDKSRTGSIEATFELEVKRIRGSRTYKEFSEDGISDPTIHNLFEFLKINEYYPRNKIPGRIQLIENAIRQDSEISKLWKFLKEKFAKEIAQYVK